jgi:hypothetical protein
MYFLNDRGGYFKNRIDGMAIVGDDYYENI